MYTPFVDQSQELALNKRMKKWTLALIVAVMTSLVVFFAPRFLRKETVDPAIFQKVQSAQVLEMVNQAKPKPTLVNIWASWCEPCREEIPFLVEFAEKYPGMNIMLVSADSPDALELAGKILDNLNSPFTRYVKDDAETEFITTLFPDWGGAIPVTLIYDKEGKLKKYWQGSASREEFENHIKEAL